MQGKIFGLTLTPLQRGEQPHSDVLTAFTIIADEILNVLYPFQARLSFGEGLGVRPSHNNYSLPLQNL